MKASVDGLSKSWQPSSSHLPFYNGGKVEISGSGDFFATLFNDELKIITKDKGVVTSPLSSSSSSANDNAKDILTCFCLHPNGNEVVISTQKLLIQQWIIDESRCARTMRGHNMPILAMCYDSTGTFVATGSADRTVRVWDVVRGYCTHSFRDHTDIVQFVSFHPNQHQSLLFSSSDDNTIRLWDLIDSECVATFKDHLSTPKSLSLSPDGYMLISSGLDKVLNFYSIRDKCHIKLFPVMEEIHSIIALNESHSHKILGVTKDKKKSSNDKPFVTDGQQVFVLVTAGERGLLRFFKIQMLGKDITSFTCESLTQIEVTYLSRKELPSIDASDASDAEGLRAIHGLYYLQQSNEMMAVTGDHNFYLYGLKANKSKPLNKQKQFVGFNDDILDILWLPNTNKTSDVSDIAEKQKRENEFHLAVITNSPQIKIFNQNFDVELLDGHDDIVLSADGTADGRYLVTSSKDKTVRVWDLATNQPIAIGHGHADSISAVAISQRSSTFQSKQSCIISGGMDKVIKRWVFVPDRISNADDDLFELPSSHSVRAHEKDVNAVIMAPNDSMIATGSQDKTIKLWKTSDLSSIATLSGHKRGIWKLAFSPIDRSLVSASGDRTIKLWSMVDYSCLQTFEGHTASVLTVKFINNGTQLVSGSADGLIKLWTIQSGECENTFDQHQDRIWAIATSIKLNQNFISGGSDSCIHIWNDVTQIEENKRIQQAEEAMIVEQQLQNDIRNKRYAKALKGALALENSSKVYTILNTILEEDVKSDTSSETSPIDAYKAITELYTNPMTHLLTSEAMSIHESIQSPLQKLKHGDNPPTSHTLSKTIPICERLDSYIIALTDDDLRKIVTYSKDWNINARQCFVSQIVIGSVNRLISNDRLYVIPGMNEVITYFQAYTEKHYERLNRLQQASYLLEYMASMMSLLPLEEKKKEKKRQNLIEDGLSQSMMNMESYPSDIDEDEYTPVIFGNKANHIANDMPIDNESDDSDEEEEEDTIQNDDNEDDLGDRRDEMITSNDEDSFDESRKNSMEEDSQNEAIPLVTMNKKGTKKTEKVVKRKSKLIEEKQINQNMNEKSRKKRKV